MILTITRGIGISRNLHSTHLPAHKDARLFQERGLGLQPGLRTGKLPATKETRPTTTTHHWIVTSHLTVTLEPRLAIPIFYTTAGKRTDGHKEMQAGQALLQMPLPCPGATPGHGNQHFLKGINKRSKITFFQRVVFCTQLWA